MPRFRFLAIAIATAALAGPAHAQMGMGRFGGGDAGDWFDKADTNGDGVVTRAEFATFRDGNFAKLDRNGDGVVSPADFPRLAKARPDAYKKLTEMLGHADSNGDGAISRAELAAAPPVMFQRADANGDGKVTKAEFDANRAQTRAMIEQRKR